MTLWQEHSDVTPQQVCVTFEDIPSPNEVCDVCTSGKEKKMNIRKRGRNRKGDVFMALWDEITHKEKKKAPSFTDTKA